MKNSKERPADRASLLRPPLRTFFRGLAAILPLAATGALITWAVVSGETLLRRVILIWLQEDQYWPGMGFVLSIALVFVIGLLMYSFIVRQIYRRLTTLLEHIPIVKFVYGMFVDVARLVSSAEEKPFRRVVLVTLRDGLEQIGFVTRDRFEDHPDIGEGMLAVYVPMSYQLGGFTYFVPETSVRDLGMSVEEALRFCVTAGVARPDEA